MDHAPRAAPNLAADAEIAGVPGYPRAMPIFLLAYVVVEALAFFLVAKLIGVGWALLAAILLMILGGAISTNELRKALFDAADGRTSVGQLAGDSALLIAGWAGALIL